MCRHFRRRFASLFDPRRPLSTQKGADLCSAVQRTCSAPLQLLVVLLILGMPLRWARTSSAWEKLRERR